MYIFMVDTSVVLCMVDDSVCIVDRDYLDSVCTVD